MAGLQGSGVKPLRLKPASMNWPYVALDLDHSQGVQYLRADRNAISQPKNGMQ